MFENPRRGRQARNFTTNVSKILDLKPSSEQIFFRELSLGAPVIFEQNTKVTAIKQDISIVKLHISNLTKAVILRDLNPRRKR